MKKLFLALVLMLSLVMMVDYAQATGARVCSPTKVVPYFSFPTTVTEDICVESLDSRDLITTLSTTDLASYVNFLQNPVTLPAGEEMWIPVRFTINSNTPSSGIIAVTFTDPDDPEGLLPVSQSSISVRFVRANCTNGQTRVCSTADGCAGTQTCVAYDWSNSQCVKDDPTCGMPEICYWSCTNWTRCINYTQTRNCTNPNNCTTPSPLTYMSCSECISNWKCGTWSSCVGGKQTRTCTDLNGCNTSIKTETQSCSTGGSGGGGGGGGAPPKISETAKLSILSKDIADSFLFNKSEQLYITKIVVKLSNSTQNPEITVKEGSQPIGSPKPYVSGGKSVDYLEITPKNIQNTQITEMEFQFRLKKDQLSKYNASETDIRMMRYLSTDKEWQKLNTSLLKQDETYAYYSAESPGFSTFAIITEPGASEIIVEEPIINTTEEPNLNQTEPEIVANTTEPGANETEPPKATGFSIADIPKSPVFMGILIFLVVVVIFVAVIKISGRNSVRIR